MGRCRVRLGVLRGSKDLEGDCLYFYVFSWTWSLFLTKAEDICVSLVFVSFRGVSVGVCLFVKDNPRLWKGG